MAQPYYYPYPYGGQRLGGFLRLMAALLIVVVVFWFLSGPLTTYLQTGVWPWQPVPEEPYVGPIAATVYLQDALAKVSASGSVRWYAKRGGSWLFLGSGNMTINLETQDGGMIYMVPESSAYYIDDSKTISGSGYVQSVSYEDIDNDGIDEHIFALKFTRTNVQAPQGVTPSVSISVFMVKYDSGISLNSPSDQTGVGTGTKDVYINWKLIFSEVNTGVKIMKIELYVNDSGAFDVVTVDVNTWAKSFGTAEITEDRTGLRWIIFSVTTESDMIFAQYAQGMNPDFAYITVHLKTTFTGGEKYAFTLEVTIYKPDGTKATISDVVNVAA